MLPTMHQPIPQRQQSSCLPLLLAVLLFVVLVTLGIALVRVALAGGAGARSGLVVLTVPEPTPLTLTLVAQNNIDPATPNGSPLGDARVVLTQGYGIGSHAPAAVWGGVDLAIDGDGDGAADPAGTMGAPIYATHSGTARVRPDTWPAGNYLAISNEHYKTAFAHLSRYAVEDGQQVQRGQIIGYVGVTGMSSGPHLHYEVWKDGTNNNPLDFGALEGS